MPRLGNALAMELPQCGGNSGVPCKLPAPQCKIATKPFTQKTPIVACLDWFAMDTAIAQGATVISLHPQEIKAHSDFKDWAIEQRNKHGYTFITMSEFVYLHSTDGGRRANTDGYVAPNTYKDKVNANSTVHTCARPRTTKPAPTGNVGYASQCRESADGSTCKPESNIKQKNTCDLSCEDANGTANPNYGDNCFANSQTPTSTGKFLTFISCDKPNNFDSKSIVEGWVSGSFPWIGNPTGNTVTGTSCNTFPENACQATDVKGKCAPVPSPPCTNETVIKPYAKGDKNTVNWCVKYDGPVPTGYEPGTYLSLIHI